MRGTDRKSEVLVPNREEIMPLRHLDRKKNNMKHEVYFFSKSLEVRFLPINDT